MHNYTHGLNPDVIFSILEMVGVGAVCLIAGICFERLHYTSCCRPRGAVSLA